MTEIRKETLNEKTVPQLIELSRLWVEEDCSRGMVANTEEDLKEPLYAAYDAERIVGYVFGHYYEQEKKTSYIGSGSRCFEIDELYVLPEYRSKGIGKQLFRAIEKEVKEQCEYLTLPTSTKDYRRILHFYVEEAGMDFYSAFLIKKTDR